jgi:CubicO group peptidase (beta-lactamase class C family)
MVTVVMRRGQVAFAETAGKADLARNKPMRPDTIFRIYSMTKPLTSTAIMMLYEEGRFQLDDPISKFIPAFRNPRVYAGGSRGKIDSVPAEREITFRDLLTHTSGLTYGFMESNPVDALYRAKDGGVDFQTSETSLKDVVERLATFPLIAQPGKAWNYSVATDVLGYLVEVISGQPFEVYLKEKVLKPLGMVDTDFFVPQDKHERLAANYSAGPSDGKGGGTLELLDDPAKSRYLKPRKVNSGGGGLVSTAADYLRFCRFMLNKGELDGVRLLGRKTVELMTVNHLKGDMADMGMPRFSESTYNGVGFGLGFSVTLDPAKAHILGTPGEFAWGGAASTAFWIDPAEDMAVVLLTQLMPSSTYPIRRELRVLTYQAIVD